MNVEVQQPLDRWTDPDFEAWLRDVGLFDPGLVAVRVASGPGAGDLTSRLQAAITAHVDLGDGWQVIDGTLVELAASSLIGYPERLEARYVRLRRDEPKPTARKTRARARGDDADDAPDG